MRLDHLLSKGKSRGCSTVGLSGTQKVSVAMRPGATPVPIPNTMVKPRTAEGTMLETAWESRRPPNLIKYLVIMAVFWGRSSVGRAPALQAGGQEFESLRLHLFARSTDEQK